MNCPVCSKNMTEQDFNGIKVDFCRDGCKSLWFDWMELPRLDETREGTPEAMREALDAPRVSDAGRPPLSCPKCGIKMRAHKYQKAAAVTIDECYSCGGFFLDAGELRAIRDAFMDEQQAAQFHQQILSSIPAIKDEAQNLEKERQRTESVNRFTRILRPSYWITGR